MKFFGKEVPPRSKPEAEYEHGIQPDEPVFREHPESLDVDSLVEAAQSGDAIGMVPELDEYYDGWIHYAQDRNLFIGAQQIKALSQARREAIDLAREKKFDELREKLAELSGPLAGDVETAAEENLKHIQESKESTHRESKEALTEAVQGVEELKGVREKSPEAIQGRHAEREARAEQFAEKYGITTEREALLLAEQNYADAIRRRNERFFTLGFRDEAATRPEREQFENVLQKWSAALGQAEEEAEKNKEGQDAVSARMISARDTIMRMEQVRQRAVAEGLDARSKTTIGKFDAWANKLNTKALGAAGTIARGFGTVSEKLGGAVVGLVLDKEEDAAKFQRASRIVGSAAIMTAIFAPAGAVLSGAAGMTFVWRVARGIGGWGFGSVAGRGAGKLYDTKYGSEEERLEKHVASQRDLKEVLRGGVTLDKFDQRLLAKMYKEGSKSQFTKQEQLHHERKMRAETAASVLVAGATAYGLSNFPHVHEALQHAPNTGASGAHPEATHVPPQHAEVSHQVPVHHAEATAVVHVESVSVHGNVNDADRLFGRFIDNVKAQVPNPESVPALRTLLEQYHQVDGIHQQDVLTRFLHLQNGGSVVVHPGDTVSFENGKVIFQGHTLIDEHGTLHNLREGGQVHIQHPHAVPVTHEEVQQPATEQPQAQAIPPESEAPQVEPQAGQPVPPSVQAAPVESVPPSPAPEVVPPVEHAPSGPAIVPPEHAPTPTPEPMPEHVEQPALIEAPPVHAAPALPVEHAPAPEAPAYHAPVPSNDNIPVTETHVEAGHVLNHNGFDLSKPSVGMDPKGNLFAHAERTGNLDTDNELSYQTALKYATQHHDATVYYIDESRTVFGTPKYQVFALKFNPVTGQVWPTIPDTAHPESMPPIPPSDELRNPTA